MILVIKEIKYTSFFSILDKPILSETRQYHISKINIFNLLSIQLFKKIIDTKK